MLAGYDTTANALTYSAYCLLSNPAKQQKLVAEIDAFGRDRVPTFDDLDAFPYLDAVIKVHFIDCCIALRRCSKSELAR